MTMSAAQALAGDAPASIPVPAGTTATYPSGGASGGGNPPAPAPAPAPSGDPWYSGIANPETKTWVEAKGFKDANTLAESAYNLEKLIGHDKAGRTLIMPKDDATPEEMKAFRSKLGVPDTPDGYKLPVPEGDDGAFAKTAATWMHEVGVPPKQAEALAGKWNEFQAEQSKVALAAAVKQADTDYAEVITSWGKEADAKLLLSKRAAAEYIPAKDGKERMEIFTKLETAIGTRRTLEMFANMGANMGEHTVRDDGGGAGNGGMTVAAAQARITALRSDKEFGKRYVAGGAAEKAEMDKLHKIAYPAAS